MNTGARNESQSQHGVSHLLEHMAFKGTERRTARLIAEEIETVGGHSTRIRRMRRLPITRAS